MDIYTISVTLRSEIGTRSVNRLRKNGQIPAILYGQKKENIHLSLKKFDLQMALKSNARIVNLKLNGESDNALIKEVQYDTFGDEILHVDFFRIDINETVKINVPIELYGTPVGLKKHGVLDHLLKKANIECLATLIPERIKVNVSNLDAGQSILIKDLEIPEGVKILNNPETIVVSVHFAVEEKEISEEEIAAPTLIEKKVAEEITE